METNMGKLTVQDKVFIFICWALTLTYCATERKHFLQNRNLSWDEARNHCQVCFKELMTLTPANIQTIAQKLTSDYWVGLRKNFNSTSNSSMSWTRWANGDPLTFQNWYPGWPVLKSPSPERDCCSCSCTCPEMTTPRMTDFTSFFTTPNSTDFSELGENTTANDISSIIDMTGTAPPMKPTQVPVATCMRTPMMPLDEPDTDQNYIEDSCVAMLRFGAWVERNCSELLPFICYEDTFIGQVNKNVTSSSASLTWLPAPGDISHYRVEVKGDMYLTKNMTSLNYDLDNLTAGTHYSVQVFPVKCERDLNPQTVAFYTTPNKVVFLDVIKVTETSVYLNWSKPAGNVYFYRIDVQGKQIYSYTVSPEISDLTPGNPYTFTVRSGVKDSSIWSEESNKTAYTRPGKATNLTVSENTNNSLLLNWMPPDGKVTGYLVTAVNINNYTLYQVNQTQVRLTDLPIGTKIILSVTALANGSLEGDSVTVDSYTAPGLISNLTLNAGYDSIFAKWDSAVTSDSSFTITIQLDGKTETTPNLQTPEKNFDSLKTATKYTVIVYSVSGHLKSPPVEASKFTLPLAPTEPSVTAFNKTYMTFQWKAPDNIATLKYHVNLQSSFWGQNWSHTLENNTSYTFNGLNSGTKYEFEVRTIAENLSTPAKLSHCTVADKREISLSMLCSSQESLLCDKEMTMKSVFEQLKSHFKNLLGDNIFWELMQETGNTGT